MTSADVFSLVFSAVRTGFVDVCCIEKVKLNFEPVFLTRALNVYKGFKAYFPKPGLKKLPVPLYEGTDVGRGLFLWSMT